MKQVIKKLILAFVLSFVLFQSCKENDTRTTDDISNDLKSEKDCISHIIAADDSLGSLRNNECREVSLSQTVKNYVANLESLNFENCSPEFTSAFQKHISAWVNTLSVTDNHLELRGEMHDVFNRIEKTKDSLEFRILVKDIWDTWAVVEENISVDNND